MASLFGKPRKNRPKGSFVQHLVPGEYGPLCRTETFNVLSDAALAGRQAKKGAKAPQ